MFNLNSLTMDNFPMPTKNIPSADPASVATKDSVKEYFAKHFSYIDFDISDKDLDEFLNLSYCIGEPLIRVCDLLYDKLLAGGAYAEE